MKNNLVENNIPVGNWENKYASVNPISRRLMDGFLSSVKGLILNHKNEINSITEVGCGEGHLTAEIFGLGLVPTMKACDFSAQVIELARQSNGYGERVKYYAKSIYDINEEERADLMVCCEVLEHLEHPEQALECLKRYSSRYLLLSVPNEPLWRVLNMARGKYLDAFGNTPGHINHWSPAAFRRLVSNYFEIVDVKMALPWTIIFCRKK